LSEPAKQNPLTDYRNAVALIKQFEGCRLTAYPDPLTGGKPWTIGYGSTRNTDRNIWQKGDTITQEKADELLGVEVAQIGFSLSKLIPSWQSLDNNQRCALISFAYNLGTHFYGSSGFGSLSTALKFHDFSNIRAILCRYCNPGSNVEKGLLRRRNAEADLFLRDAKI
jgi:lysozyme